MKKGISLPIEMIVIIAIAVLVLVVVVAFFFNVAPGQMNVISERDAISQACTKFNVCLNIPTSAWDKITISNYNATCNGKTGNTMEIICCKLGYSTEAECKLIECRCSS